MTTRARATDPATSHAAARSAKKAAAAHVEMICDALERREIALSCERIAEIVGLDSIAVTRRMRDMERAGLVRRDGIGQNRAGRAVTLWRRS